MKKKYSRKRSFRKNRIIKSKRGKRKIKRNKSKKRSKKSLLKRGGSWLFPPCLDNKGGGRGPPCCVCTDSGSARAPEPAPEPEPEPEPERKKEAACATCGFPHQQPDRRFDFQARTCCHDLTSDIQILYAHVRAVNPRTGAPYVGPMPRHPPAGHDGGSYCLLCGTLVRDDFLPAHFAACFEAHLPVDRVRDTLDRDKEDSSPFWCACMRRDALLSRTYYI